MRDMIIPACVFTSLAARDHASSARGKHVKIEVSIFALGTQYHCSPRAAVVHHDHDPLLRWPRYIAGCSVQSKHSKHSKSPPSSFFHPIQAHAIDRNIAIPKSTDDQLSMQRRAQGIASGCTTKEE